MTATREQPVVKGSELLVPAKQGGVEPPKHNFTRADLQKGKLNLQEIAFPELSAMGKSEERYLASKGAKGLQERYQSEQASKDYVTLQIKRFAAERGVNLDELPPELKGIIFADDHEGKVAQSAVRIAERFFNSEKASLNPEKNRMVKAQTEQYLKLISQAQEEGSVSKDLTGEQVYKLVSENIAAIAFQDRAASENLMGDHGVRHIAGHNIRVSMELADQLQSQGVMIGALDRLVLHQAMILHDFGYALDPVRAAINKEGIKGQDTGHNLLSAQLIREKAADPSDSLRAVFSGSDLALIHRGVLYHDQDESGKAGINFSFEKGKQPSESRALNIESIVRTADNTHAFEDKLPELLYRIPDTLKYMRLLKTAGETGNTAMVEKLKGELAGVIGQRGDISEDDKQALTMAVKGLNGESYNFSVGRICGNKPVFTIIEQGGNNEKIKKLMIEVQESAIHREVMGLFGKDAYDQLKKFLVDNLGKKKDEIDLDQEKVEGESLVIKVTKGDRKATETTDYQRQISELLAGNPQLTRFSALDIPLSLSQKPLEDLIKIMETNGISEGDIRLIAKGTHPFTIDVDNTPIDTIRSQTAAQIENIKKQRTVLLNTYLQNNAV